MPKRNDIKKVLVIGSGPIVIGQAAEFDYAGTQGCIALKEEGIEVVLVNNNPATIMTDHQFTNTVYFEPMTVDSIEKIIEKERPDGIIGTLGGQTGLNLTVQLYQKGILERYGVDVLGTKPESIIQGEDRDLFRSFMQQLQQPVPESMIIHSVEEALTFSEKIGFPLIVRPAYTLGGGGGGIATNKEELITIVKNGLDSSPINQCLVEKSIAGFKEIEFEMIRDENDTCIAICCMENFDPVGIHTGDSIVIAPQQTLSDKEYETLYRAAVKIIRALKIVGGCNIQFALDPNSNQYYIIEVNPRVSRSSALASKATGYPIAQIATKLALGYYLHELVNPVTGTTYASMEPVVDYTVVKMPRWPFDKFISADKKLGTQMKATGEIMAIERNLPAAFQKAVRSLELKTIGLELEGISTYRENDLWDSVLQPDHIRFFAILELFRRGVTVEEIHEKTKISIFFLEKLFNLVQLEKQAKNESLKTITPQLLKQLKQWGFSDEWLAYIWKVDLKTIRQKQREWGIVPVYYMVDSCAGEFQARAPYYYSSWRGKGDQIPSTSKRKIAMIGSGPIRIGQGIEFDYCTVQGVLALKKAGFETILINNNPGTVSTDFQIADRLYFEPLCLEDVLNVLEFEKPDGVIVQFGGQTAINLAKGLEEYNIPLLSISQEQIDVVEDRDRFYNLLQKLEIPHIPGVSANNSNDLLDKAKEIGFPILLRPSYVIGGQGMLIIGTEEELQQYIDHISYPVLIDAFYKGIELEVDALSDGEQIFIPGYFQHIERAGVHSGDSIAVTPPISISSNILKLAYEYTEKIAKYLQFKGIFNVQFVIYNDKLFVLEVNPRASRTVPIISKMTGVNLIDECIRIFTGGSLSNKKPIQTNYYAIKIPVFSTAKLSGLDPILTPEMKSTGEYITFGNTYEEALSKAFHNNATNKDLNIVYLDVSQEFSTIKEVVEKAGFQIANEKMTFSDWLKHDQAAFFISFNRTKDSERMRMKAVSSQKLVFTEMETLYCYLMATKRKIKGPVSLQEWHNNILNNKEIEKVIF